jgi:hypothetical protein
MPHEYALIALVLLIWLLIVYHFFVIYGRVAMVNPTTLGGYSIIKDVAVAKLRSRSTTRDNSSKSSMQSTNSHRQMEALIECKNAQYLAMQQRSESSLDQNPQQQRVIQRRLSCTDDQHQLSLLKDAVSTWRSEAVLASNLRLTF